MFINTNILCMQSVNNKEFCLSNPLYMKAVNNNLFCWSKLNVDKNFKNKQDQKNKKDNKCLEELKQMQNIVNKKFNFAFILCELFPDGNSSNLYSIADNIVEEEINQNKLDNYIKIFSKLKQNKFFEEKLSINNDITEYAKQIIKINDEKKQEEYIMSIEEANQMGFNVISIVFSYLNKVISLEDEKKKEYKDLCKMLKNEYRDGKSCLIVNYADKIISLENKEKRSIYTRVLKNKYFQCLGDLNDFTGLPQIKNLN